MENMCATAYVVRDLCSENDSHMRVVNRKDGSRFLEGGYTKDSGTRSYSVNYCVQLSDEDIRFLASAFVEMSAKLSDK